MACNKQDKEAFLKSYKFPKEVIKWAKQNTGNLKVDQLDTSTGKFIEYTISPCKKFILKFPDTIIGKKPKYAIPTKNIKASQSKCLLLQPLANTRGAGGKYDKIMSQFIDSNGKLKKGAANKIWKFYGSDLHSGNIGVWKRRVVVIDW